MSPSVWINSIGYPGSCQSDWKKKIEKIPISLLSRLTLKMMQSWSSVPEGPYYWTKINAVLNLFFDSMKRKVYYYLAKVYISFQDLLFLVFKSYFALFVYITFQVTYRSKFSKHWRWCHVVMQLWRCNFVFTLPVHKNLLKVHKMLLFSIP